ncbi:UNVERIFIED_CONTAM: hypothetical protein Sradi_2970100 [Sesamum radiatum]|uniref:BRX domain-containing protein n=1 Tax=Sesamum radiatum TaxID=300843 RepID=A0AAW2S284_SESRA
MNARAADEAEKSKAAKEVIKSLTAQLKEMAERVPVEQLASSNLDAYEQMASEISRPSSVASVASLTSDSSDNSSTLRLSNGTKVQGQKPECIIQDEPGVYITLVSLPNDVNELRRCSFQEVYYYITFVWLTEHFVVSSYSRKHFTEDQAEKWWAANGTRLCERYNIKTVL